MKKLLSLILACLMLFSIVPVSVFALEEAHKSGVCGDNATWTFDGTTLEISGTGAMYSYFQSYYGDYGTPEDNNGVWMEFKDSVKKVIVNEGITSFGYAAFLGFSALEEIQLPDSLVDLGQQTFQRCDKLTEITIPAGVKYNGNSVSSQFSGDALKNIYVDADNQDFSSVDGVLFDKEQKTLYCYSDGRIAKSYTIPEGVEVIEYGAFSQAVVENVTFPKSLKKIGRYAFFESKLKTPTFYGNLEVVEENAFENCDNIKSVIFPESVSCINSNVFLFCDNLSFIKILNSDCRIANVRATIPSDTELWGYSGSTAEVFAKRYGLFFVDIETEEKHDYNLGNSGYMALLPTDVECSAPAVINVYTKNEYGETVGCRPTAINITDTENQYYKEIAALAEALSAGCETDYEKAEKVCNWVSSNMTYVYGMFAGDYCENNVYVVWQNMAGNCECYTILTCFLLYLMDIPTATVTTADHIMTAALVEGEWILVDSTNGWFDGEPNDMDDFEQIVFMVNENVICVINDLASIKLAGYGYRYSERDSVTEITVPDFINEVYDDAIPKSGRNGIVPTIKGAKGSYIEEYLRSERPVYNSIVYESDMFIAKAKANADANGDGIFDVDDYIFLKRVYFGTTKVVDFSLFDIDGNGMFEADDYILLKRVYFGTAKLG